MKLRQLCEEEGKKVSDFWEPGDPDKFHGTYRGMFDLSFCGISSFEGCPSVMIDGDFCMQGNQLSSFEGITPKIVGHVKLYNNSFNDLHDIHKHLKKVYGKIWMDAFKIQKNVLGLLLIEGLIGIHESLATRDPNSTPVKAGWGAIINGLLPNHRGKEAVYLAQEKLIEAEIPEFAHL